ncbi:MAG: DUF2191 domain-containing protein [Candidatus Cloacimonadota bacterium]|nr:MAG: DUF2191 domain-containing protein [Candidatus Cloacimonadota bacterium]
MRTNIIIDDKLMNEALLFSQDKTKKSTVEEALRLFVQINKQSAIRNLRGKLNWDGNLEDMRLE